MMLFAGRGQEGTDGGNRHPVPIKQGHVAIESRRQPSQRFLLLGGRCIGRRQYILHQPAERQASLLHRTAGEMPQGRGRENEQDETGQQGDIKP